MKRMTSEIINTLQEYVDKYGDLPFELLNDETGAKYYEIFAFARSIENSRCDKGNAPAIGIAF